MEFPFKCFLLFDVVFTCAFVLSEGCEGLPAAYGSLTKDHDVEVGTSTKLECTIFSHEIFVNGVTYNVTSEHLAIKFQAKFLDNLEIINTSTVQYSITNASLDDGGVYNCYLVVPGVDHKLHVCTSYVTVGYPPRKIKEFSCISMHYVALTCTWQKPFNPIRTDYEIYDYILLANAKRKCPELLNSTTCQWSLDSHPPYRQSSKVLYFLLVGNNSLGTQQQFIHVEHFKIVKPAAPNMVITGNLTEDSVEISWLPPKGMEFGIFPPGVSYWIHYRSLLNPNEVFKVEAGNDTKSYVVTGLYPSMEYMFSMRCRSSVAERDEFWSPFVNISAKTRSVIPYLAPELTFSSFQVQTVQDERSVTLYWKPIPKVFENGDNFQYVIKYHVFSTSARYGREDKKMEVGNCTSYSLRPLGLNSAYRFQIYAKNSMGPSNNISSVIIDKSSKVLSPPRDISVLSHGQGNYTISWKEPLSEHSISNYTLFWCSSIRPRPFKCEGHVEWKFTHELKEELELFDKNTNYQFAVAANSQHMTSGMQWALCVVPYSGVLDEIKNVIVTPKNSTSLRVSWTLDCNAQKKVILEYKILYCPYSDHLCSGKVKSVNFNQSSKEEYIIGYLTPFTTYRVVILARTTDGWSEDSPAVYENTLSGAPSDPPRDVQVVGVNDTNIHISFDAPSQPNGVITRYVITYCKTSIGSVEHTFTYSVPGNATSNHVEIRNWISYYSNYSIYVVACVGSLCSPHSAKVYAFTGIGKPGPLEPPHTEVLNSTFVNVTWKPPEVPNGPIDFYIITMDWIEHEQMGETKPRNKSEIFNVSGHERHLTLSVTCPPVSTNENNIYFFSVQAVNIKGDDALYSSPSGPTQTRLCFFAEDVPYALIVGLAIGGALGMGVLVIVIYALAKWMKKEVDMVKGIAVQLPAGLDSPTENPLSSYDKFKNGLQKDRDSGIPTDLSYGRFSSSVNGHKSIENSINSCNISTQELLIEKQGRQNSGRNYSGDSNISSRGHDSISSSNTNRTHLSIDSGAEVDLPPSPDGVFSETSSSNTTPRSYKPDLAIVKETNATSSKDSGLEKEGISGTSPATSAKSTELSSRFAWYVQRKNHPYSNMQFRKNMQSMHPYSKFAVIAPVHFPTYIPVGNLGLGLLDHSLANSEPSVADFEGGNDCEPLVFGGVSPYCRFGLARSAGNGLNFSNQIIPAEQNLGYSKFGIVYRPLKCNNDPHEKEDCLSSSSLSAKKPYVRTFPNSVEVEKPSSLFSNDHDPCIPFKLEKPSQCTMNHKTNNVLVRPSTINIGTGESKTMPVCAMTAAVSEATPQGSPEETNLIAKSAPYSKFSIQPDTTKPVVHNGYVSFYDTLNNSPRTNSTSATHPSNSAYSKFSVNASPGNISKSSSSETEENLVRTYDEDAFLIDQNNSLESSSVPIIGNHLENSSQNTPNSYITFQDAKVMFSEDTSSPVDSADGDKITSSLPLLCADSLLNSSEVKTDMELMPSMSEQHPSCQLASDSSRFEQNMDIHNDETSTPSKLSDAVNTQEISAPSSSVTEDIPIHTSPSTKIDSCEYVPNSLKNQPYCALSQDITDQILLSDSVCPEMETKVSEPCMVHERKNSCEDSNILCNGIRDSPVEKSAEKDRSKKFPSATNGYVSLNELTGMDFSAVSQPSQTVVVPVTSTFPHFEKV